MRKKTEAKKKEKEKTELKDTATTARDLKQEPSLILEFFFSFPLLSCLDVPDNIHEYS